MKLNFLLGSGVSIPANFPNVEKLTGAVLSGDGIVKHGDTLTAPSPVQQDEAYEDGRRRLIFLNWLKAQACARYAEIPDRYVNYEDLAYLAGQIADDIDYEYENPAVKSFIRDALTDLEGLFRDKAPTDARQELVKFQQRYQMRNRILSKAVPALEFCPFCNSQKCAPFSSPVLGA